MAFLKTTLALTSLASLVACGAPDIATQPEVQVMEAAVEEPMEVELLQCDKPRPNLLPGLLNHVATKGTAGESEAIGKIEGFLATQEFNPPLAEAALVYLTDGDRSPFADNCWEKLGV